MKRGATSKSIVLKVKSNTLREGNFLLPSSGPSEENTRVRNEVKEEKKGTAWALRREKKK